MKTGYCFAVILLFAQKLPATEADCKYDRSLNHCSCVLLDLNNIMTIISCNQASTFEFSGGIYMNAQDFITYSVELEQVLSMVRVPLNRISFVNIVLSEEFLFNFLNWIQRIPMNLLSFENTTFVGQYSKKTDATPPLVSSLLFTNVFPHPFIQRDSALNAFGKWMSTLGKLTVMKSNVKTIPCNSSLSFESVSSLDLSENLLGEGDMSSMFCDGAFTRLKTLKLRRNNLVHYKTVCQTLQKYNQLTHLDLSQNQFSNLSHCEWQPSLINLNLSNTGLQMVTEGLPQNCEVLDLSHNALEYLNISLTRLKDLYLSYNRFTAIPSMGTLPRLQILAMDGNLLNTINRGQLQYFENLNIFKADNNPYMCSCSFVNEMKEITESELIVQQWPEQYVCRAPDSLRDRLVSDISHSFFECHTHLLIVLICIIILLLTIAIIICFVKIHRSSKTRSHQPTTGDLSTVQYQK